MKRREKIFLFYHIARDRITLQTSLEKIIQILERSIIPFCATKWKFSRKDSIPRIRIYARHPRYICQAIRFRSWMDTTELRHLVCASKKFQGLINLLKGGWSRLLLFHVNIVATAICLKKKKKGRKVDKCFFLIALCK